MNGAFRQSMSWLHTWAGLTFGWVLYFIFVTGTAGYFDTEIDRWMQPEVPVFNIEQDQMTLLEMSENFVAEDSPGSPHWYISFPSTRYPFLGLGWQNDEGIFQEALLDPQTGEVVTPRETGGGQLLYKMHYELHYLPHTFSDWLVGICTMFMLVGLISGVITHKKIFKDFFTFRPGKKQRSWLDLHNLLSVLSLPFQFMITYSGLMLVMYLVMPAVDSVGTLGVEHDHLHDRLIDEAQSLTAQEAVPLASILADVNQRWGEGNIAWIEVDSPAEPGAHVTVASMSYARDIAESPRLNFDRDTGQLLQSSLGEITGPQRFQEVMTGLHIALFAGPVVRWGFFFSGLLGCGMVATGLILWSVKRRTTAEKNGRPHKGLVLVERLNVGTIVGLPAGIAAYFWANRLLPADLPGRMDGEVLAMFVVWGLTLLYPVFRPMRAAWIELLWFTAAAFCLLPLLNFMTTDRHLWNSITQEDWVMAGFDLTVLALGIALGAAAYRMTSAAVGSHVEQTTGSAGMADSRSVAPEKVASTS